jgi:hypothetical protein
MRQAEGAVNVFVNAGIRSQSSQARAVEVVPGKRAGASRRPPHESAYFVSAFVVDDGGNDVGELGGWRRRGQRFAVGGRGHGGGGGRP